MNPQSPQSLLHRSRPPLLKSLTQTRLKIADDPHQLRININVLSEMQNGIDVISPLCRAFLLGNDGSSRAQAARWTYTAGSLPIGLRHVDIWFSYRLAVRPFNTSYPEEFVTLRCKSLEGSAQSQYSPVFVLCNEHAEGIHCE
jgi:hypothetical protein